MTSRHPYPHLIDGCLLPTGLIMDHDAIPTVSMSSPHVPIKSFFHGLTYRGHPLGCA
jgi:adenosylmethionine-8-amino-7-oxononanoate aminotransferase